jgi:hypothetical protein
MEKIQIQFRESDYKIYYDYCQKYYRAHDAGKKQALHAFLDLFEKGSITVDEQDIRPARQFLSGKCDALRKENTGSGGEGENTTLLQLRICSDLLLLTDDLEKIYRLIQKQGVVANYVMILGTFSRVIDENRHLQMAGTYNLNPALITALANPLAGNIRARLGTDRNWQSVLRELSFIAARFNQRYTEPRFDLDIAELVAPAVVSHFNKDINPREILSAMPSFFNESELDEFESFLNQTPEILKNDQEADIDWDALLEPLKAVASEIAVQRDKWSQGRLKIAGSPDLSTGELYPAGSQSVSATGFKTFDISVSPDSVSGIDSPLKVYSEPEPAPEKSGGIKPFLPVIVGVAIIIIFILGTLILSGNLNLMGNTTNATAGIGKNTTIAKTNASAVKPTATAAKSNTTVAKSNATVAKTNTTPTPTPQTYSSLDIGNHLMEIAFGPDNSKIQKPTKDLVTISCSGQYSDSDTAMLNDFISQFNIQSSTTKIAETIQLTGKGDITLEFLPETSLDQVKTDDDTTTVTKNMDTGEMYLIRTADKIYVNSDMGGNIRKRWILRAVLFDLGFLGETAKYQDSLFYAGNNNVAGLNTIDWKAVQLMYGRKITNGMTKSSVKSLVAP